MSDLVQVDVTLLGRHFSIATPAEERETLEAELRLSGERMIETAEIAANETVDPTIEAEVSTTEEN